MPRRSSRPARRPDRTGSAHLLTAPYQAFRASDGWINIGGANQANWERIAEVLGHPEWRDDPRFATNSARMANRRRAGGADERRCWPTRTKRRVDRRVRCRRRAGRARCTRSAKRSTHPQTLARGMVVDLVHPQAGPTKALGCPVHFSATPTRDHAPGAAAGRTHARSAARVRLFGRGDRRLRRRRRRRGARPGMMRGARAAERNCPCRR